MHIWKPPVSPVWTNLNRRLESNLLLRQFQWNVLLNFLQDSFFHQKISTLFRVGDDYKIVSISSESTSAPNWIVIYYSANFGRNWFINILVRSNHPICVARKGNSIKLNENALFLFYHFLYIFSFVVSYNIINKRIIYFNSARNFLFPWLYTWHQLNSMRFNQSEVKVKQLLKTFLFDLFLRIPHSTFHLFKYCFCLYSAVSKLLETNRCSLSMTTRFWPTFRFALDTKFVMDTNQIGAKDSREMEIMICWETLNICIYNELKARLEKLS